MRFSNWDTKKHNWSLRDGASSFIANFFIFLLIAFALEFILNIYSLLLRFCLTRKVTFENNNKGCIEIMELQERHGSKKPIYNFIL